VIFGILPCGYFLSFHVKHSLTITSEIGQIVKGQLYYGHFLTGDDFGNESASERLLFAESLLEPMPDEIRDKLDPLAIALPHDYKNFSEYLRESSHEDFANDGRFSDTRYNQLEDLLRRMLAWKSAERISAKEALKHPLFDRTTS
jgi:serine/threonine protein kinase